MGSIGNSNQNTWPPYGTYQDCSQGICSMYCPQWCYIIFPPPPPFMSFGGDREDSSYFGTDFSPLIIAIIGILVSAFILVSYYTLISKYCTRRSNQVDNSTLELNGQLPTSNNSNVHGQAWQFGGLEDSVIKSITVAKYKTGDGLIEGTDCSVCLSEFQENESLRLLPKCNHAFHVPCIDMWLKSHANCPLCRANVIVTLVTAAPPPPTAPTQIILQAQDQGIGGNNNNGLTITNVSTVDQYRHSVSEASIVISEGGGGQVGPLIVKRSASLSSSASSSNYSSTSCNNYLDQEVAVSVGDILRASGEDDEDANYDELIRVNGVLSTLIRSPHATARRSISTGRLMMSTRHERGRTST